ncbi:GAF and ANTAR domain-containing protein [Streptomyces sp. NPDC046215]|uniref:GAF domain-containing protein n=1 Tax=Streptomyces stramineus TaxID=173861 RepID=A0ABN1BGJ1_9ACTN
MDARENVMAWGRVVDTASAAGSPVSLPVGCTACAGDVRADGLGVCLITSGRIRSVAYAADERSHRLENAQLVAGEGPCTEAYLFRRTVEMDLREPPERWPVFVRTAAELGIRSVTAVPLLVGDVPVGVMDLYRTTPNPLSDDSRARLDAYARVLALLALDAHPALIGWEQAAPEPGPQGYPPLVHQAAGAAAVRSGVGVDEALARMRAHAFSHHLLLLDVAHHILDGRLRLEEDRDTP